jgi:thymidylate synthase (FAD)
MNVSLLSYTKGMNNESPEELALMIAQVPYKTKSVTALHSALDRGHLSILEHISFTFRIEGLSRVAQQQLTRHRMASYTIQSERHTRPEGFVVPDTVLKALGDDEAGELWNRALDIYNILLERGVPKEDARFLLPLGAESGTIICTMNLRELRHFFDLRRASSAQWEIRDLADAMKGLVDNICPNLFEGKE